MAKLIPRVVIMGEEARERIVKGVLSSVDVIKNGVIVFLNTSDLGFIRDVRKNIINMFYYRKHHILINWRIW